LIDAMMPLIELIAQLADMTKSTRLTIEAETSNLPDPIDTNYINFLMIIPTAIMAVLLIISVITGGVGTILTEVVKPFIMNLFMTALTNNIQTSESFDVLRNVMDVEEAFCIGMNEIMEMLNLDTILALILILFSLLGMYLTMTIFKAARAKTPEEIKRLQERRKELFQQRHNYFKYLMEHKDERYNPKFIHQIDALIIKTENKIILLENNKEKLSDSKLVFFTLIFGVLSVMISFIPLILKKIMKDPKLQKYAKYAVTSFGLGMSIYNLIQSYKLLKIVKLIPNLLLLCYISIGLTLSSIGLSIYQFF